MPSSKSTAMRLLLPALLGTAGAAQAQQKTNTITTAVPFITISPDARSAALGDAGAAISPDANAPFHNAGKLGFLRNPYGASASYSPWLRNVTDDMSISALSGYKKLGQRSALAASLTYFDLGSIDFRSSTNQPEGTFNPKEYSVSLTYGQKLSEYLGVGVTTRYIRSNLTGSQIADSRPGNAFAVDLGVYYNRDVSIGAGDYNLAFGAAVSNIGNKITYTRADQADFLPTNLKLGTAITRELDAFNKITLTVDANKLLVPTPYYIDGVDSSDPAVVAENDRIARKSIVSGILGSFSDAPGGASEEFKEINLSAGAEYWYNDLLAARVGYFYENPLKGDRQYLCLGLGLRYQVFGVDAAYLVPNSRANPLANTIRVSLHFNFGNASDNASSGDSPSN
ncbi:type IX secretion system outer membrane channel protein PorV [Hymenobacter latericus]|uniref:type IX secretion system outer membrane channel protein PorV n=1 Tax=Hymenobacter sp. YIM 151858-1 TaxID=2987688 RepID=UPI0022277065|nr:type IX secretion system outer membrane channel protein PorV [Hymenobacter sp. YIM 151858-1]UYZ57745.1 type IX secretion system outer membrane channel protein PorV [Hymenobacter sp. YIM 151858-1]